MQSILYLGTDEGVSVLRGDDAGLWTRSEADIPKVPVEMIEVSPERPNRVFVGTRGDGVWVSEDFGETFHKPSWGLRGPGKVRSIALDPGNASRIYAGCEPIDLFRSDDLGKTWERIDDLWNHPWIAQVPYSSTRVEPHVRFVLVDPYDQDTIYLALQVGYIIKTTNAGASWELLDGGVDMDVHSIIIDYANPQHVLAASGGHNLRHNLGLGQGGKALFASHDGGSSWSPLAMDLAGTYAIAVVTEPSRSNVMYSAAAPGTPGQWKREGISDRGMLLQSTDSGESWNVMDTDGAQAFGDTLGVAMAIDRARPDRLCVAGRNGEVIVSDDAGESWRHALHASSVNDLKLVSV